MTYKVESNGGKIYTGESNTTPVFSPSITILENAIDEQGESLGIIRLQIAAYWEA